MDPRWNSTSDGIGPQFVDTKMHALQVLRPEFFLLQSANSSKK